MTRASNESQKKRLLKEKKPNRKKPEDTEKKFDRLVSQIGKKGRLLISLSGGVDSALVAHTAFEILGDNAAAVTILSELVDHRERGEIQKTVREIGIRHIVVERSCLNDHDVVSNSVNRCYYCKTIVARVLVEVAGREGFRTIADGVNADDREDAYRPGVKASDEAGIWHPLAECGFSKAQVRTIAKKKGLGIWDKPSNACLASRISYGETITRKKLEMIEKAETLLGEIFSPVRVRLHGTQARIEIAVEEIPRIIGMKQEILTEFKRIGFSHVTLDLEGYRSGSMNDSIRRQ
jgi:uncharacterized protein